MGSTTVRISESAARELKDSLARAIDSVDAGASTSGSVSGPGYRVSLPGDDDGPDEPNVH